LRQKKSKRKIEPSSRSPPKKHCCFKAEDLYRIPAVEEVKDKQMFRSVKPKKKILVKTGLPRLNLTLPRDESGLGSGEKRGPIVIVDSF